MYLKKKNSIKNLLNRYPQVKWVFLESNMFNKLFNISNFQVFKKYDVSSLETVLFGDAEIRMNIHVGLIRCFPNASIVKVYGVYAH